MANPSPVSYSSPESPFMAGRYRLGHVAIASSNAHAMNIMTGTTYYTKGTKAAEDVPASLTKLATLLVLIDKRPTLQDLEEEVTITASDRLAGGTKPYEGDVLTLHGLLMNALLPSSNISAKAIGRVIGQQLLDVETGGVGDPIVRFVAEMNAKAASVGCTDTAFANTWGTGLENSTTPADINAITRALWQSDVMRTAFAQKTYSLPVKRSGTWITENISGSNEMKNDAGIVGGKTGTLTMYNLMVLYQRGNGDVIAVTTMGASSNADRYADARALVAAIGV